MNKITRKNHVMPKLTLFFILLTLFSCVKGSVIPPVLLSGIFVDLDSKSQYPDGSSWGKAFRTIKEGVLKAAQTGEKIYVSAGVYKESLDLSGASNIYLAGGYKPGDIYERNVKKLAFNKRTVLVPEQKGIIRIVDKGANIHFDGFIFEKTSKSSAIFISGPKDKPLENITISNSEFSDNQDWGLAGALSISHATVKLSKCTFSDNKGPRGAVSIENSEVTINNSIFDYNKNTSTLGGGAISIQNSMVLIENTLFLGNTGEDAGAIGFRSFEIDGSKYIPGRSRLTFGPGLHFTGNRAWGSKGGGAIYAVFDGKNLDSVKKLGPELVFLDKMEVHTDPADIHLKNGTIDGIGDFLSTKFWDPKPSFEDAIYFIDWKRDIVDLGKPFIARWDLL